MINQEYIGKSFGNWIVLDYDIEKSNQMKKDYYSCQCKCGKIIPVYGLNLKNNKSKQCKSCSLIKYTDENMAGRRFGKLTVLYLEKRENGNSYWRCKCDCGNETVVLGRSLFSQTRSCGCLQREKAKVLSRTHGKSSERIYCIWENMLSRCYYNKNAAFNRYGGRGIKVCDQWKNDFESFYNWAKANGYNESLTIDRIDNDGDYTPSNCRWVSVSEQANNRSTNRHLTINGERLTISQIARKYNLNDNSLRTRLKNGATQEDVEYWCNLERKALL